MIVAAARKVALMLIAALVLNALPARAAENDTYAGGGGLSCPPSFLTETEKKMFAKEGNIRSGPWHVHCFQNGNPIYDRDHIYMYCQKNDTQAALEGADGHAIRFQFSPEVACIWER